MKEFFKILELKPVKPIVWNFNSKILQEKSHTIKLLLPYTHEEKLIIFKRKIIAISAKPYQKKQTQERWLVKSDDNTILGPFTKNEMKSKSDEEMKNCMIKRDFDKEFVKYEKIKEDMPNFLESEKLNEYFNLQNLSNIETTSNSSALNSSVSDNSSIRTQNSSASDCTSNISQISDLCSSFYNSSNSSGVGENLNNKSYDSNISSGFNCITHITKNNNTNNKTFTSTNTEQIEKSIKKLTIDHKLKQSKKFLKSKNESCNIHFLFRKLHGKNQKSAVNIVKTFGNLNAEDAKKLVELIVKETGNSVLVDNEGFIKAQKKFNKK